MMKDELVKEPEGTSLADLRLQQLLQLKQYEKPDSARMIRNKQNIMRRVREAQASPKWSLSRLVEVKIPWFFAEPRYGIAALLIVFAGLQILSTTAQRNREVKTGIYMAQEDASAYGLNSANATNQVNYPVLPSNIALFPEQKNNGDIQFVGKFDVK